MMKFLTIQKLALIVMKVTAYSRILLSVGGLCVAILLLMGLVGMPARAQIYIFTGHVYQGKPPNISHPIGGVTVELYGDQDEWPESGPKAFLTATTTNNGGEFRLHWELRGVEFPYYHIIEVDPPSAVSTGAHTRPPGYVKNFNVVSYLDIPPGKYDGTAFWDFRPEVTPPEEGWCCREGDVFPSSEPECHEQGGRFFYSEEEARELCRVEVPPPEEGWCCLNSQVSPSSEAECLERGGNFFPTQEEAEEYCREGLPDLAIIEIAFDPRDPLPEGEVTIRALIRNVGNTPVEEILVSFIVDRREFTREIISHMEPGRQEVVTATWRATTLGDHALFIEVDPEGWIRESNEENNILEGVITIRLGIEELPDLVLTGEDIISTPAVPYIGDEVIIEATIRNEGNAPAQGVSVVFQVDGDWEQWVDIEYIHPGDEEVVHVAKIASSAGEYLVTLIIDPENRVKEWNEDNNMARRSILVKEEEFPELAVAEIHFNPESPHAGQAVVIRAIVVNQGNWHAADFFVSFLVDDIKIGSQIINRLSPDTEEEVRVRVAASSAGEHNIEVIVDPGDWIRERDEKNNEASSTLMVRKAELPDLVIENITVTPETPARGEEVAVSVTIRNKGRGIAEWVAVYLAIDIWEEEWETLVIEMQQEEWQTLITEIQEKEWQAFDHLELIEYLEPGQRKEVTTTWTATWPGDHTLIAEIDSLDSVRESDETNNKIERLVRVKEE